MEGILFIPPERGTLIGRAVWKPRYVIIGPLRRDEQQHPASTSQFSTAARSLNGRAAPPKPLQQAGQQPDAWYLSIYKGKPQDEWDPLQRYPLSGIVDCQVQMAAHRKQGPVLPTLIITFAADPASEKLRKRRSSRTAGLSSSSSSKDLSPTTQWFRPGDDHHTLADWARCIQSQSPTAVVGPMGPLSPVTPASPSFINPFASRSREPSEIYQRPNSGNPNVRPPLVQKQSAQTSVSGRERDRPVTFSESPSLRSRRSDISHASSMVPLHLAFGANQAFPLAHPADVPSPAATINEYQGEFIEGWTSAQGRSSTVSSPIRGRDSVSSQSVAPASLVQSSSPPGPRETILDRAFQLRCIPGSENEIPGEEKLSSLARFDALMREVDAKRKNSDAPVRPPLQHSQSEGLKSGWDLDQESDTDGAEESDDADDVAHGHDGEDDVYMPVSAQRALDFIASRRPPSAVHRTRSPLPPNHLHQGSLINSGYSQHRPQTGHSKHRPGMAQRTHSQPQLAADPAPQPTTLEIPSATPAPCEAAPAPIVPATSRHSTEKRHSTSSIKRLSFTEFTKRLSSTSSLLLVQTNASSSSGRGSSEMDAQHPPQQPHAGQQHNAGVGNKIGLQPRGAPPAAQQHPPCGWRGSVGVFGAEGGFL